MNSHVAAKIESFFASYPLRTYPKGQILVFAREEPSHIFYLISGRVRMYDISYRGDEVVVNIFQAPSFFPMSWGLNKTPNWFFFSAETAAQVRVAPPSDVVTFIKKNPDVMLDLLTRLYSGVDSLLGRMVQLMAGSARHRLIYELIIEARRFGENQPDGSYHLSVSEADLAARSGMSRETVSREFSKLTKELVVRGGREGIVIFDLNKLEQILGS